MMGSGGLIVMDEDNCMVDIATLLPRVHRGRVLRQVRPLPHRHRDASSRSSTRSSPARASFEDIDRLEELANYIKTASLCGLGQTAPNPVLSTLRYFRG